MMKRNQNHLSWCMDSCRWDSYHHAYTPHMDSVGTPRMVYARAGMTTISLFGVWMNLSWYQSNDTPVPWMKKWCWLPTDLRTEGYYTALITGNPLLKLYKDRLGGWDEYIDVGGGYQADRIVEHVKRIYRQVSKPKYIFLLFMETHQPYPYSRTLPKGYETENYRPVTRQIKAVEALDKEFRELKPTLTDTDVLIFSDHGDLDLKIEGAQGHGPSKYHPKLFEIPYIRGVL